MIEFHNLDHRPNRPGPQPVTFTDPTQAIRIFDAESKTAQVHSEWVQHARVLMAHQEWDLAKTLLRRVLEEEPNSLEAIDHLGQCLREQKEFAQAEKCFAQLASLQPSHQSFFQLAEVQYVMGHDAEAFTHFSLALRFVKSEGPLLFETYKNIGNIHVRAGDFEAAEENYNRAYTLNPRSDALMVNYGTLEIQRENYAEAIERFRSAVAICAENDRAWIGLAVMHRHFGDVVLAWANLERALDLNPNNESGLKLSIDWALQDHRVDRAIEQLRAYVDGGGADLALGLWLARLLFQQGLVREAACEVERVMAWDSRFPEASELAAIIHSELKLRQGVTK